MFIVNTADCRLIGGDCVYLHINLPNYTARPATYRRRAIENLTRPGTLRRNISGLFFFPFTRLIIKATHSDHGSACVCAHDELLRRRRRRRRRLLRSETRFFILDVSKPMSYHPIKGTVYRFSMPLYARGKPRFIPILMGL